MNFVFVSPDGSASLESFWSARARSGYALPCWLGCDGERLPEADMKKKGSQEKMTSSIPGFSAPCAVVVKCVVTEIS